MEQQRLVHRCGAGAQHPDRPVPHFPAVAVRAVQHVAPPPRQETRLPPAVRPPGPSSPADGGHERYGRSACPRRTRRPSGMPTSRLPGAACLRRRRLRYDRRAADPVVTPRRTTTGRGPRLRGHCVVARYRVPTPNAWPWPGSAHPTDLRFHRRQQRHRTLSATLPCSPSTPCCALVSNAAPLAEPARDSRPPVITDERSHTVLRRRANGEKAEEIQPRPAHPVREPFNERQDRDQGQNPRRPC